jgi:hypothetical protein
MESAMSMQLALRPYVTAGIALVGASVIAVSPIVPSHSEVHLPAVNLTTSIDNPFQVFAPVVDAAGNWIASTIQTELTNPFPILQQIATNQITTATGVLEAVRAGAAGVGEIVGGLPAALGAASEKLAVGDVNGAIDAIMMAGLNPFMSLIFGTWTPLQTVFERPFQIGQAMVPAMFEVGLSLTLAAVLSTVGIGFDTGTTPFIQQIVKSTQAVLTAVTTLNPINVLNAIQHGIADVALNFVTQLNAFTAESLPYIRGVIVTALQAGAPVAKVAAISAPEVSTPEVTTPEVSTPVKDVVDEGDAVKTEPAVDSTTTEVNDPETVSTPVAVVEPPATETVVTNVSTQVEISPEDDTVKATTGSTTVTRDSLKAEPGKTGLASGSGTGSGSSDATESTGDTTVSDSTDTVSAPSSDTDTSASSDSSSDSDSGSSDND